MGNKHSPAVIIAAITSKANVGATVFVEWMQNVAEKITGIAAIDALQATEIHYSDIDYIGGDTRQDRESPRQEISA